MELLGRRWIWVGLVKDNYREGDLSWALQSALNSGGGGVGERGRALQIRELLRIKKGREKTVFCKQTSLAETDLEIIKAKGRVK